MKIAAFVSKKNIDESYLLDSLSFLANKNHKVDLLTFKNVTSLFDGITCNKIIPNSKIGFFIWNKTKLPKILNNYDCIITDSITLLNKNLNIPQYLYLYNEELISSKKNIEKLLIPKNILVTESYLETKLTKYNNVKTIFYPLKQQAANYSFTQLESFKAEYSKGFDYILFNVNPISAKHIIVVLKAYSQLKKWQKTSLKLLLLTDRINSKTLITNFNNYKHKNDVIFLEKSNNNYIQIISAAFANLFFSGYSYFNDAIIAMQNNVPVIAENTKLNNDLFGNAAKLCPANELSLFETMQQLYKDEFEIKLLQQEAKLLLKKYDNEEVAKNFITAISN